jgi:hypothetical protein
MSLSKLSIFSKDTDANEVVKGYEYQKLRTLENWLFIVNMRTMFFKET